jgi:hypothetical protein
MIEVLASHEAITMYLGTQYPATWVPYLLFAYVLGIAHLQRLSWRLATWALVTCAVLCHHALVTDDVLANWYALYRAPNAADARLAHPLAALPPSLPVAVPPEIYAHLWRDRYVTVGPTMGSAVLVDTTHEYADQTIRATAETLRTRDGYRVETLAPGVHLYVPPGMSPQPAGEPSAPPRTPFGRSEGRTETTPSGRGS